METLLGSKYVRLVTGRNWTSLLRKGAVITDTSSPTEVLDLQNIGTPLLEKTNAKALNDLLASLASVTKDKREEVATIVDGLNRVTAQVNQRQDQTGSLITAAKNVSGTLANRDQQLVSLVDNLNVVVRSLADQRAQLVELLGQTAAAARQTADLVGANRVKLDAVLDELHQDLVIVGRHQVDLAQSVAYLGVAIQGFSSIGYSGAEQQPEPVGQRVRPGPRTGRRRPDPRRLRGGRPGARPGHRARPGTVQPAHRRDPRPGPGHACSREAGRHQHRRHRRPTTRGRSTTW